MSDIVQIIVTEEPIQVIPTNFIPVGATAATASYAISSSYANVAQTANTTTSASFATTASYAANVPATASFAVSSSFASVAGAVSVTSDNGNQNHKVVFTNSTTANETLLYDPSGFEYNPQQNTLFTTASTALSASNVLYNDIGQKPTLFSGSSQVQLSGITGTTFANTDFTFPANVNVLGTATVKQLYTQYQTSSIIYDSGSTKFGDTADDTHQFTGSLTVLGTISGALILPGEIVSSSSQVKSLLPTDTVSSSNQVVAFLPTGVMSGSTQTVANIAGQTIAPAAINATGVISASNLLTSNSSSIAGITIRNGGLTTSSTNISIGQSALERIPNNVNATGSIAIGFEAGNATAGAANALNVFIGHQAAASASSLTTTVAIGALSMMSASAAANTNTAVGYRTLMSSSGVGNTAIGANVLNALRVGVNNTGVGASPFNVLVSGSSNTAVGRLALSVLRSGSDNTSIGLSSIGAIVSGNANTALGVSTLLALPSGNNNIALGHSAGRYITSGSNELFINSIDRSNSTGDYSSSIIYGRQDSVIANQTLRLNAMVVAPYGITGSIVSASFATTASAATSITFTPTTASYAITASYAANAGVQSVFPFSGSAVITGSLTTTGVGGPTASITPVDLNGIMWSGSYGSSSIVPSVVSASDLGSQTNPFRNAYFTGFISASNFVGYTASVAPTASVVSASFTYFAASATPVSSTSGAVAGIHDEIKACVMDNSGSVLYYLNPTNWSQRADTTPSSLNADGQHVMIEIPKLYWKASQTGTGGSRQVTYSISTNPASTGSGHNFQLHPAFYKSGSFVNKRYVSAYLACGRNGSTIYSGATSLDTGSVTNQLASISGSAPLHTRSKTSFRQLAVNIGNGWGIHEIYLQNALELLYITEYQNLNTQEQLGNGNGSTSAVAGGSNAYANGSTPNGYVGSVRYRGIENLWGVLAQWVDGMVTDNINRVYVTNDHTYFADYPTSTQLANYTRISGSIVTAGGGGYWDDYYEYATHPLPLIIPNTMGASSTTKFCDYGYSPAISPSGSYSVGVNGSASGQAGWFYREVEAPTRADQYYGTRITY